MPTNDSQRLRIQRKLVSIAKDTEFPVVTYGDDGSPNAVNDKEFIKPSTPILCNETQSVFAEDERYRRGDIQTRQQWTYALRMKFDREVLLEFFEEALLADPPVVERDDENGFPQATLRLIQSEVSHPVQQGAASGTIVEFTFEAEQGRK